MMLKNKSIAKIDYFCFKLNPVMNNNKSIAILCAGGPAPGINTVVATIAKIFIVDGYRVLGLNYGYKTLFTDTPDYIQITYEIADRIFDRGGSYLKMSRYKPKPEEYNTVFFQRENISLLVTIGGDDTASTANKISIFLAGQNVHIQNIHVPKTIDNDLPLPENIPTFGYHTAKNEGVRAGKTLLEDARTSDHWFVVSAMGREAGHLAIGIGSACHYPMIIIPEMFGNVEVTFDRIVKMMVSSMVKRKLAGINYGAVIISEGVFHFISDEEMKRCGIVFTYDEHGHPELGKISKSHLFNDLLGKELAVLNLKFKTRPEELGYTLRCVDPIAYDLRYCTKLGYGVRELYERGESQCIVVITRDEKVVPLYMKDITGPDGKVKPRLVDVNSELFRSTLRAMEYITPYDYEKASEYLPSPEQYNLKNILNIQE